MATNKMSKELKASSNRINSLKERKEKKLNEIKKIEDEIKDIEADITKEQEKYNELLKNESIEKVSKAMFSDNRFTAEQVDSLMKLFEQFGSSLADIDPKSVRFKENTAKAENEEIEKTEIKVITEESKVDTSINFSDGEAK